MSLGERVKTLRKRLNMTQKQFAAKMPGKSDYTYIGKIERDDQYPSIKFLKKIGDTFSVPLSYFFEDGGPRTFHKRDFMGKKVRSLACLLSYYRWDTGHFSNCGGCEMKELCDALRGIITVMKERDIQGS